MFQHMKYQTNLNKKVVSYQLLEFITLKLLLDHLVEAFTIPLLPNLDFNTF